MFAHIRTPLLRFFCMHSGFCGIQLTPIRLHQPASILLLLWNILYNISTFWGVSELKLINADSVIAGCTPNSRTLFGFLIHHSQKLSSYSQMFIIVYFLVYGRKLVAAFDSEQFQFVYRSRRMSLIIFCTNFAFNHLSMGAFLSQAAQKDAFLERNLWERFCTVTGYYTMFSYTFWLYNIIHYCQFAFSRYLVHLEKSFLHRKTSSRQTLAQVQSLALISKQINVLLSFPFLFYVSLTAYSIVLTLSTSIICTPRIPILFFTAVTILYMVFIVLLNRRNGQAVGRLFGHLHRRIDVKERALLYQLQSVSSRRVELTECETLYSAYLDIRIFQMSVLNSGTLWQAVLFILLYVILFSQTVNEMDA
ncbi:hypothetical protein TYRP_011106 [Tyrophagus putrescentiae]|nr:hypothetical protein TYRP_011106 [Tyrophagus putrescentiae]